MTKNNFIFSAFTKAHINERVTAINSYDVLSGILIDVPATVEKTESWADSIQSNQTRRDFVLKSANKVIGFSGLVNINHKNGTCELYIFVAENMAGKGVGSFLMECTLAYAKQELGLRKVSLYVSDGNDGAMRFYERLGFLSEGCLKDHIWHRGSFVDRHLLSLFLEKFSTNINIYKILE